MARAVVTSNPEWRPAYEPLYDTDPRTGASVEVFWADRMLAKSFGRGTGWFWWTWQRGSLPDAPPIGPFATSYAAYRDALGVSFRKSGFPSGLQRGAVLNPRQAIRDPKAGTP